MRNAYFGLPTCFILILCFSCGVAVPIGEGAKPLILKGFKRGQNAVLRSRRGTL